MRRVWKIFEFDNRLKIARSSLCTHDSITKPLIPIRFSCQAAYAVPHTDENQGNASLLASLFTKQRSFNGEEAITRKILREKVCKLKDELLQQNGDICKIGEVLEEVGRPLFRRFPDGSAVMELLMQLRRFPILALEVFVWRRDHLDYVAPMRMEEYSRGILIAGRLNNVDLAVEFFKEACNKELKGTSIFNSLMSAYKHNGFSMKCQLLFNDLKTDPICTPSVVTYNILISAYGRIVLVDHMEAIYKELKDSNLSPNVFTYSNLILGYVIAWRWEEMEKTYWSMKTGPIKPNLAIDLLILRGYAVAGKLEKMEEIYDMVMGRVPQINFHLIRIMIRAYCLSSDAERVQKVEQLLKKIPEDEYRPWLIISLICLYAKADLLDQMEVLINKALRGKTYVTTVGVMNTIISCYFRHNAVDKLDEFVKQAEIAGWKRSRSIYHSRMILYSFQMRLYDMERVLHEMYMSNMHISEKTYLILLKAYHMWNQRSKLKQVVGIMCKHGYKIRIESYD